MAHYLYQAFTIFACVVGFLFLMAWMIGPDLMLLRMEEEDARTEEEDDDDKSMT